MAVTKFFRIGVEGATTDGRNIERSHIEEMAETYNPKKFGARIWLEHLRGLYPGSAFKAYGDVVEVKAEEVEIDGEKKLALYAKLDVTDDLVALNKKREKIYTSMEVSPNFAKSGKAYLSGLAVTDDPASLGTEMLQFSAGAKTNPLSKRKQDPENLFTEAIEIELEFEDEPKPSDGLGATLLNKVKDLLGKKTQADNDNFTGINDAVTTVAESQRDLLDQFSALQASVKEVATIQADLKTLQSDFNSLKQNLSSEADPKNPTRPSATGGDGVVLTDC